MIASEKEIKAQEKEYYQSLDEFVQLCNEMIDKGLAYWVVVLSHELYRFLYPVEPYAKFTPDNPVEFVNGHIKKLISSAKNVLDTIHPYSFDLNNFTDIRKESDVLGQSTSDLYADMWRNFDSMTLVEESLQLVKRRLPDDLIEKDILGKDVLDMGCGSGRYSIALAKVGAKSVSGVDWQKRAFEAARLWCEKNNLPVNFREGDVLNLPFENESFDFVFSNGVIHHTHSIQKGLQEIWRVLRSGKRSFLYIYAANGIFWKTRNVLREVFKRIPLSYTQNVLDVIGMPSNRFIFCDTWYVPVETHTTKQELHSMLDEIGFKYEKVFGKNEFDLDGALEKNIRGAEIMWGDGEHRYILEKA
ncbi:MAG: methyltransferase domain-containing protein [Anaerolineales bacterium]|nr:methyltransferase domain-containing protein [Anaerolineales bacterium]